MFLFSIICVLFWFVNSNCVEIEKMRRKTLSKFLKLIKIYFIFLSLLRSTHQPSNNFLNRSLFCGTFKLAIALKHSPSKRKSLSKAIQRSIDSENEARGKDHQTNLKTKKNRNEIQKKTLLLLLSNLPTKQNIIHISHLIAN